MFLVGDVGRWQLELLSIFLLMTIGGIVMFRFVRDKARPVRLLVRSLALVFVVSGVVCLGSFLYFLMWPNPNTYSSPMYSPNRKMAARIWDYDLSGFGGADSSVELFATHGLRVKVVFHGDFRSIDDVRWFDDRRLLVRYHKYPEGRQPDCVSPTFGVDVVCDRSDVQ